ncbi:MAG: hypothetical protein ACRDGA_13170 [Bacteroidota bacterium]
MKTLDSMIRTNSVLRGTIFMLCWLVWPATAHAQMTISGGNILMNITSAQAGSEPTAVTNTICTLTYRRQASVSKVTVSTSCPGQKFTLRVVAVNPTEGVAAPQVTLVNGMLAAALINNIPALPPATNRTCTLSYTASATFAQGNSVELGDDVHTVTYTIVAQ